MLRSSGVDEERKRHDKATVCPNKLVPEAYWTPRLDKRTASPWEPRSPDKPRCRRRNPPVRSSHWQNAWSPGAQAPAVWFLYAERWPKRPWDHLPYFGNGCDGLGGLQTRQVIRSWMVYWAAGISFQSPPWATVSYPLALWAYTTALRVTGKAFWQYKSLSATAKVSENLAPGLADESGDLADLPPCPTAHFTTKIRHRHAERGPPS